MSGKCKNCNVFLRKIPGYNKVIKTEEETEMFNNCFNKSIVLVVDDILCNKCRLLIYPEKRVPNLRSTKSDDVSVNMEVTDPQLLNTDVAFAYQNEVPLTTLTLLLFEIISFCRNWFFPLTSAPPLLLN